MFQPVDLNVREDGFAGALCLYCFDLFPCDPPKRSRLTRVGEEKTSTTEKDNFREFGIMKIPPCVHHQQHVFEALRQSIRENVGASRSTELP